MFKWINRHKVSFFNPSALPSLTFSGEAEQFEQLFHFAFKCFRLFAITPGQMTKRKDGFEVRNTRWMLLIVTVLVLMAWVALIETFFVDSRTALITGIANHIQFIMNTFALTAAWIVPQLKSAELEAILEGFLVIDRELSGYKFQHTHFPTKARLLTQYGLVLLGLSLLVSYDGFVSFGKLHTIQVWYWVSHQLPFVVYAMALLNAFVLISWLHVRFRHLNALVEQYYRQEHGFSLKQVTIAFATSVKVNEESPTTTAQSEYVDDLQILAIVSRTIDLAQKIESYFGLLFLTVYTALFSVTTIQLYFCYLHLTYKSQARGFSTESLVLSSGIILTNVIAIVALPFICEKVEHESKQLMSFLSKLSMKRGQTAQHSSIWFPNLISSVRFSALGFFNVNYNMLSGLVAGMVTYLIIFIQFNSMVPAGQDDQHQSRRHQVP